MEHHRNSGKLNLEYTCTYDSPVKVNKKMIWGFKLVMDVKENYYSVGTGLFRYMIGKIKRPDRDYSILYKNTKYWCNLMKDRIAIFNALSDIDKFYPNWKEDKEVAIIKIAISDDIISLDAKNKHHTCRVYAGKEIKFMEKL